jgi:membrane protein required for colicin V production
MHPADGVLLAIIAVSMLFGIFRGFLREVFALAGWIAAYFVARFFHAPLDEALTDYIATPSLRLLTAWGGLFVTTLLLVALAGYMIRSLMDSERPNGVDRLLGALFGAVRGMIVVLVLLIALAPFASRDPWWQEARLPREFMRYEFVGRELKQKLMQAARDAAGKRPAPTEDGAAADRQP